jgi:hypothetical protein
MILHLSSASSEPIQLHVHEGAHVLIHQASLVAETPATTVVTGTRSRWQLLTLGLVAVVCAAGGFTFAPRVPAAPARAAAASAPPLAFTPPRPDNIPLSPRPRLSQTPDPLAAPTGDVPAAMTQLIATGDDVRCRSIDLVEICRPEGLGDIANLGLTLPEAKSLLASVQRAVVSGQADSHGLLRPDWRSCGGRCHVKDWRGHCIATLFGEVAVRLPRFLCAACNRTETGVCCPSRCRSTPELDHLQAHLSALMAYRVASALVEDGRARPRPGPLHGRDSAAHPGSG